MTWSIAMVGDEMGDKRKPIEEAEQNAERGSLNTYKTEAASLGRPWDKVHQKVNVADELAKLSFFKGQRSFAPLLEAT